MAEPGKFDQVCSANNVSRDLITEIHLRKAQELGYHRLEDDCEQRPVNLVEDTLILFWDIEHKKRLWARLFILDRSDHIVSLPF